MALGLLKAILAEGGITASVAYANLWFAESVGLRRVLVRVQPADRVPGLASDLRRRGLR